MKPSPAYFLRHFPAIFARFAGTCLFSLRKFSPSERKLLVVKLDALGDQVLFSFVLRFLREAFNGCSITVLVQEAMRDYYRNCPHVDRIFGIDKEAFYRDARYAYRKIREIREERFAVVLHPTWSREPAGDQCAASSGAPRIIGTAGDATNEPMFLKRFFDRMYTERIPERVPRPAFEGFRYMAIPAHFDVPVAQEDWKPCAWIGEEDRTAVGHLLERRGIEGRKFAVLVPGARERIKCWNPAGFSAVGDRIIEESKLEVLLAGTSSETALVEQVRAGMEAPCHSVAGETTVSSLTALIERAAIVVGNDSASIHLAMATGTPAVCVLGGGHYGRFLPYPGDWPLRCVTHKEECFGCNWVCPRESPVCITHVTSEEVWRAIKDLLDGGRS